MTAMTLTARPIGDDDEFHRGAADAHADHTAGTPVHLLLVRADWLTDYIGDSRQALSYALGYSNTVLALQAQSTTQAVIETILATYERDDQEHADIDAVLQETR
jgi:hypothetical protein